MHCSTTIGADSDDADRVPQHPHRHPAPAGQRHRHRPELRAERDREKEVIKRRAGGARRRVHRRCCAHIARAVVIVQRRSTGDRDSFDRLDALLVGAGVPARVLARGRPRRSTTGASSTSTSWRRSGWKTRRSSSACTRSRSSCSRAAAIDGLRIDHVDGLYDPGDYLRRLQARAREIRPDLYSDERPLYLVVEKILGIGEELPDWPVDGTTGYDFLADAERRCSSTGATSAR